MIVTIPWKPHAKQRPRHGKSGHTFTPKATRDAEAAIAAAFLAAAGDKFVPFEGPLKVEVMFANEWVNIVIEEIGDYAQRKVKGDVDNYLKTVGDALNGVAWVDDKQIVDLRGVKM